MCDCGRPPFLGQGANQALQDAFFLAKGIKAISERETASLPTDVDNEEEKEEVLSQALVDLVTAYEGVRRPHTALLVAKSVVLGYIETLSGPGVVFRDWFFRVMGFLGIAQKIFVDGARPRV